MALRCARSSARPSRLEERAMISTDALSRRAFLTSTGALVVTLAAPSQWASAAGNGAPARPSVTGDQLDSYITIDADGTVVAYYGKIDGGQGLGTAFAQKGADFKVIGQSFRRRDLPGKVFGTLEMVNDVRLPGMLHARMIRPTVAGAVPVKVDEASIKNIAGAKVVWIKDLLAVVAEQEWNAVKAARALAGTWSESKPNFPRHDKLHEHIRKAPVIKRGIQRENGSVEEGLKQAARVIVGQYEYPTQFHSSMGPACAVADVRGEAATIWTSTQKPYDSATCVAELLGLPREKVRAIWMFGTGSYGRNDQGDATADAAVLSKHLGRPVRVQYMRHEGIAWDPKGTAAVATGRAGVDASGKVIAYEYISKAFSRTDTNTRESRAADVLAGHLLGLPLKPDLSFEIPIASYTFDHPRLGWGIISPLIDPAPPPRPTPPHHPLCPPILFGTE